MNKIILFLFTPLISISIFAQTFAPFARRDACPPGLFLSNDGKTCGTFVNAFCPTPGFVVWDPPICRPQQSESMACPDGALLVFPSNEGGLRACFMPEAPSRDF